ncbi:hypothetical protein CHS0354_033918 [Potamilus streckersoni]|uniref:Uncharacterized protein n=1 Tax=Potamilus streckersoni TaxID=2493646 RepID=A0AAE0RWY7_9BIVA|nr:hypothetical protein CHS0354_033918 [Potamilus streckersoni]
MACCAFTPRLYIVLLQEIDDVIVNYGMRLLCWQGIKGNPKRYAMKQLRAEQLNYS